MKNLINKKALIILGLVLLSAPSVLLAAKDTIGIAPVQPNPALAVSVTNAGKANQMDQVLQSLDEQLVDRIHNARKFELVARGDLKIVFTEQAFANSGNVDAADKNAAQQFKLAGAKYVLATKVDGFKDYIESYVVGETGQKATIRVLSLSAMAKIYDPTTGKLKESTNFQIRKEDRKVSLARGNEHAALSDELLVGVSRMMAEKVANRLADVIYPAKVVDVTGTQVTINWGDGMFIAIGEPWNVFETKVKKDPDDPDNNIVVEIPVGIVEITSVFPKTSTAKILTGDRIAEGNIVRRAQVESKN